MRGYVNSMGKIKPEREDCHEFDGVLDPCFMCVSIEGIECPVLNVPLLS